MRRFLSVLALLGFTALAPAADLFEQKNRVAWCIVPFDSQKRTPAQRVAMLKSLGFTKYAYDWRAEHLPSFDEEVKLLKKAGIELTGVWFPAGDTVEGTQILKVLNDNEIKTQLWVMLPQPDEKFSQEKKVEQTALTVFRMAKRAEKVGHTIGLYNHGGWTGEPENLVAVLKAINQPNVGIVYNLHHAHEQFGKFEEHLKAMKPYLNCLNLNGMKDEKSKILPIGLGTDDGKQLKTIKDSGYTGPVGILGHTDDDAMDRLADNLNGLDCLLRNDGFTPLWRTVKGFDVQCDSKSFALRNAKGFEKGDDSKFQVYVATAGEWPKECEKATPLLGTMAVEEKLLRFTPRFAPQPGESYRVVFDKRTALFAIPKPVIPESLRTKITAVYPTSETIPENTLRMYLHFSAPMKRGDSYKHIKLINGEGREVNKPFLELDEELWSKDNLRLTLLFDPGRVKRGLKPREDDGPILEEAKKFTLVIDKNWEAENGEALGKEFQRSYWIEKPLETAIEPEKWKLTRPQRGGHADPDPTMTVDFGRVMDSALAERMFKLIDETGNPIHRYVGMKFNGSSMAFGSNLKGTMPPGKYKIVIDPALEDICGNRIGQAFEVDGAKPKTGEAKPTVIAFEVK